MHAGTTQTGIGRVGVRSPQRPMGCAGDVEDERLADPAFQRTQIGRRVVAPVAAHHQLVDLLAVERTLLREILDQLLNRFHELSSILRRGLDL